MPEKSSRLEFTDDLFSFLLRKPKTLKEEINEATRRKRPGILEMELTLLWLPSMINFPSSIRFSVISY